MQATPAGAPGHGSSTLVGACASDRTRTDAFENPNRAWPAMTVPTHVPCAPFRRLVAEKTGSLAAGTKDSPPMTVSSRDGTTAEFAVSLSITATMTPWPALPSA